MPGLDCAHSFSERERITVRRRTLPGNAGTVMKILTNFGAFPRKWTTASGIVGCTEYTYRARDYRAMAKRDQNCIYLVNCDVRTVLVLALGRLLRLLPARPLVAVDLQLRRPRSVRSWMSARVKGMLFRQVDLFINYFRDARGLETEYGVTADRTAFVAFKANLWSHRASVAHPRGDYVLCFGRSLRDFDTFFSAVERVGFPAVIVDPRVSRPWDHGSRLTRSLETLPSNVSVRDHDMSDQQQVALIREARLVVVPIVRGSIVASGISTILNGMALGKCVIASEGIGVSDVFDGELLTVPVEQPEALANTIARAWDDDALRLSVAEAGLAYASACGTEQQMFQRVIECLDQRQLLKT